MPYRKTKKVQAVKIVAKKRTKNQRINSLLYNNISKGPIKNKVFVTMGYASVFGTSLSGNTNNEFLYNLNNLFDSDQSGVGHQPYGRDGYAILYNRYRVWKCRYEISLSPASSTPIVLVVVPTNSTAQFAPNTELAVEAAGGHYKVISAGMPNKITGIIDMRTLEGANKGEFEGSDRYQAQMGSPPTELSILHVHIANQTGTAVTCVMTVKLQYYVELFDPNQQTQS